MHNHVNQLNSFISDNYDTIDQWIQNKKLQSTLIYSSIDIRSSGFKISPIDSNLFPSGFHHLSKKNIQKISRHFIQYFDKYYTNIKKIALILEEFTRNADYYENIKYLYKILQNSNFDVKILTMSRKSIYIKNLTFLKFQKTGSKIKTMNKWTPDLIILNNDLTKKIPCELNGLSIPILPNLKYGWHTRRKFLHCKSYNRVITLFCKKFKIDPWLISSYYTKCNNINFKKKEGLECLVQKIKNLLTFIKKKYAEYNIKQEPIVFVKSNNGTFGRCIISVKNVDDIMYLNKKKRHSLYKTKDSLINSEVIIQEGVPTIETIDNHPSENVLYLINAEVIGEFTRYNTKKDFISNLNSKGMLFTQSIQTSYIESALSRLATIACSHE